MKVLLSIISLLIYTAAINTDPTGQGKPSENKCLECHAAVLQEKVKHLPVQDNCIACHAPTGKEHPGSKEKGFMLTKEIPQLCYSCHEVKNNKKNVHSPSGKGKCMNCHTPHSSPGPGLLIKYPVATLCQECHKIDMTGKKSQHKAVTDGSCLNCHDPHQSDFKKLMKSDRPLLCLNCHEKIKEEMKLKTVHPPFERNCLICHSGHSSDEDHLLSQKATKLCFVCHDDVQADIGELSYIHSPLKGENSCFTCHSPHASADKKLLLTNEMNTCLNCHNKSTSADNKPIVNIAQMLQTNKYIHGAIEKDGCSSCHRPHASKREYLLSGSFPLGNYSVGKKENFELCFTCHSSELIEQQYTSNVTGFRNGMVNLHYLHIHGNKGRNCLFCHDVHVAMNKFLIADKVQFGNWEMPLKFSSDGNGGSCYPGCHDEKQYKR